MGITRPGVETLIQVALAPEKKAEAQHTAMGTRTRSPCPALALQNAPQTDAIHEDRARAFQKEKTSCQGTRPNMKAHAHPCLKPLMICDHPSPASSRQAGQPCCVAVAAMATLADVLCPHMRRREGWHSQGAGSHSGRPEAKVCARAEVLVAASLANPENQWRLGAAHFFDLGGPSHYYLIGLLNNCVGGTVYVLKICRLAPWIVWDSLATNAY